MLCSLEWQQVHCPRLACKTRKHEIFGWGDKNEGRSAMFHRLRSRGRSVFFTRLVDRRSWPQLSSRQHITYGGVSGICVSRMASGPCKPLASLQADRRYVTPTATATKASVGSRHPMSANYKGRTSDKAASPGLPGLSAHPKLISQARLVISSLRVLALLTTRLLCDTEYSNGIGSVPPCRDQVV